jgi:hypothetical protein
MLQLVPQLFLAGKAYDLTAAATSDTVITLSFLPVPGARSYEYQVSSTSAVAGFGAWTALATNKQVTGLTASTPYWFRVRIVNGIGRGPASRVVTATTAGGSWTPATPAGLIGWWKADVQSYNTGTTQATNGQTIDTWIDQSGNGNSLTNVAGFTKATYASTGLNGKPSLDFDNSGPAVLRTALDSLAMGTGNAGSMFILGSLSTTAASLGAGYAGNGIAGANINSDAGSGAFFLLNTTPDFTWAHAFDAGATPQTVTADTATRMGMIFDGTNATPYKNNVAGTPQAKTWNWTSPGTFYLGTNGFQGWDGQIREVILYNTALGSTDRDSLEAYLLSRT